MTSPASNSGVAGGNDLRVAVVVEHAWHRIPGGTGTAVDATIRALLADVSLILSGIAAAHRTPGELAIATTKHWLPRPLMYEGWHRLGWPRSGSHADVIWAPAMAVPPHSKPTVVTVHDVDFLEHPERLSRRGASFFPRAWQAALERADIMAVPSDVVRQAVIHHGADASAVEVIPWGVDIKPAVPANIDAMRSRLGLDDPFVLWVGTAEPRKNLAGLVAAMQPLDAPLVVVGPDGWGIDLDDTLAPLGQRAIRLGRLERGDLEAVYALATVFAFPSFDEGFGLPVLEAMAQGTAVVTSSGTATEEVAGGAASLVDPRDIKSIRAGIVGLLNEPGERSKRERAGLARAAQATWANTAHAYSEIFRRLGNPLDQPQART